jgi:hypothetical protein
VLGSPVVRPAGPPTSLPPVSPALGPDGGLAPLSGLPVPGQLPQKENRPLSWTVGRAHTLGCVRLFDDDYATRCGGHEKQVLPNPTWASTFGRSKCDFGHPITSEA